MGTVKDRNYMDLTEAEDTEKRWQEYTELYKKRSSWPRRSPGEGKGYPLQYSGLENSKDCIVSGVAKSWTQLNDFHLIC